MRARRGTAGRSDGRFVERAIGLALVASLAAAHGLHILQLATPLDRCVRNLIARRRARRDAWPLIARAAAAEHARVEAACERLRGCATVEVLGFEEALLRARELLGLERLEKAA